MNYVFVDYENVHDIDLSIIGDKEVVFTLVVGGTQKKLDVALVERMFECSSSVKLVRLEHLGKNAVDFAIAYYAGRSAASDPAGYVHIVSNDGGFNPLIEHLKSKGTRALRHGSFEELSFSLPARQQPVVEEDPWKKALAHFQKNVANRPKKRKKLLAHLSSLFANKLSEKGVRELIERFFKQGYLKIDDKETISYHLPG